MQHDTDTPTLAAQIAAVLTDSDHPLAVDALALLATLIDPPQG